MGSDRLSPPTAASRPASSVRRSARHVQDESKVRRLFKMRNQSLSPSATVLLLFMALSGFTVLAQTNKTLSTLNKGETCYQKLEGEEGFFESPNYPANYPPSQICNYDIIRPSQLYCGVRIFFEDMNIPGSAKDVDVCSGDYVAVESCVPEGGNRFCGSESGISQHYNFQAGSTALRVTFHSDATVTGRGFRIRYKAVTDCSSYFYEIQPSGIPPSTGPARCFTRISEASGTINTPYHPKNYPENLDCVYQFLRTNPNICGIRMKTVRFDLQEPMDTPFGGACSDFFHMPSCGFLCGKLNFSWFARFQPNATSLEFHFHSDEAMGLTGFLISFEQIYDC